MKISSWKCRKRSWNFKLQHIYLIAILDFKYDEKEEIRKFERYVQWKDQDGDVFYEKLHFKFPQMPLFNKSESELESRFDKWCYFLKNLENFDHIPSILNEPIFEKAFHTSEIGAMTKDEYNVYTESLMAYWESKGIIDTARAEGEQSKALEIALKAIEMGMKDEQISILTGLPMAEIRKS